MQDSLHGFDPVLHGVSEYDAQMNRFHFDFSGDSDLAAETDIFFFTEIRIIFQRCIEPSDRAVSFREGIRHFLAERLHIGSDPLQVIFHAEPGKRRKVIVHIVVKYPHLFHLLRKGTVVTFQQRHLLRHIFCILFH